MPLEVLFGPVAGFIVLYLIGWSLRNEVHNMNGPRDYAQFAAQAMGVLFFFGFIGWAMK